MNARSHTPKGQIARERILRAAEPLIAARGFHGTSMRDVAEASGQPLATVVYHFARKEALHGAVLSAIAEQLLAELADARATSATKLEGSLRGLIRWSLQNPARVRLLMRELLDNPSRVSQASSLPLAPVLTSLSDEVRAAGHPQPELAVLHVVGAVSYVVAARPTVRRIVGSQRDRGMMEHYADEAFAFAMRALDLKKTSTARVVNDKEQHHAPRTADRARPARTRAHRSQDDGHGAGGRDHRRQRLRR